MASRESRELAAQAWCRPTTSGKVVDHELCEAFAEILDTVLHPAFTFEIVLPNADPEMERMAAMIAERYASGKPPQPLIMKSGFTITCPPGGGKATNIGNGWNVGTFADPAGTFADPAGKYESASLTPGVDFALCDGSKAGTPYKWAWEPCKAESVVMAAVEIPVDEPETYEELAKANGLPTPADNVAAEEEFRSKERTRDEWRAFRGLPPLAVVSDSPVAVATPPAEQYHGIFDIADRLPSVLDRLRVGQREEAAVMLNRELRLRGLRPDGRMVDPASLAEVGGGIAYRWKKPK